MGTPNNQSAVDLILRGPEIPVSKLDANDWLKIVKEIINVCKPYLDYFSGFSTIGRHINPKNCWEVSDSVLELPVGINKQTPCMSVSDEFRYGQERSDECPHFYGHDIGWFENLLLLRSGILLHWKCRYKAVYKEFPPFSLIGRWDVKVAEICKFSPITDQDLFQLMKVRPHIGEGIIRKLNEVASRTVDERRTRLQKSELVAEKIEAICSRVNFHS